MVKNIRPKEAEVQDIANIVVDGSDAIQLSQETSNGINIEKSIVQLSKSAVESETMLDYSKYFEDIKINSPISNGTAESGACAAVQTALDMKLNLILVLTETGNAARLIAKYRPSAQIFACAFPSLIIRQL
jgi:pyruvate kinase